MMIRTFLMAAVAGIAACTATSGDDPACDVRIQEVERSIEMGTVTVPDLEILIEDGCIASPKQRMYYSGSTATCAGWGNYECCWIDDDWLPTCGKKPV